MTIRIGGLASGIDTESIIEELMQVERNKVDLKEQQKQILEWKRDDFREVNTKLLAVRNAVFDLTMESTFNGKTAESSNETILTATAESTAVNGTYAVTVKQLAQRATMSSQAALGSNENVSSVAAQFGIDEDAEINFTLTGEDGEIPFSFTAGSTSLTDIVRIINEEEMGISAYYDSSVDRVFLMTTESGSDAQITVKADGMLDDSGNIMVDANGECLSFLEDYLKLDVDVSSLNETSPASGRKITGDSALIIHEDDAIILSEMYEGGTAPATVSFTLEGDEGSFDFTFDTTISIEEMINQINDERLTTGLTAAYDSTTGQVAFVSGGQVTISNDTDNFLADKLNMTIGSQEEYIVSNTALRVYDPLNIDLNALYTCEDITFVLEGGLGNHEFNFNASDISTTTVQDMLDSINNQYTNTGIRATYDGDTGKISLWDSAPVAALESGSTATNATLAFDEALYSSSDGTSDGVLTALTDAQDITARFTYTGTGSLTSVTYNSDGTIDFVAAGAADGDTITLNAGMDSLFDAEANQYIPISLSYDAAEGEWIYDSRTNAERKVAIRYDNEGFIADELNISMAVNEGTAAIIDFNDAQNLEFDTNEITLMDCINLSLHNAAPGQTVVVNVDNDIDTAVEKINTFVEAYNTAVVLMNTELTERRYNATDSYGGSYKPLTDEQKEEMTDDEIEAWEAKAKSGMLRGDSILFSAYSTTRMGATDPVEGLDDDNPYSSLSSIGISTGTYVQSSLEGAKLYVDETTLREALEADPESVAELFTLNEAVLDDEGEAITDWNGNDLYNKGVGRRLYDILDTNISAIATKAGSATSSVDNSLLTQEIGRIDERIALMEERIEDSIDRYWDQFTTMEQLISSYTSQSEWLAQQIAQLSGQSSSSS